MTQADALRKFEQARKDLNEVLEYVDSKGIDPQKLVDVVCDLDEVETTLKYAFGIYKY